MKIHESRVGLSTQVTEQPQTGHFAGRTVSSYPARSGLAPLATALRRTLSLNLIQEQALDRLQQGEHKPLSERRVRLL